MSDVPTTHKLQAPSFDFPTDAPIDFVCLQRLQQLPDDALVLVLRYLDVPSLLNCRLVCKRLGALALHRDAWRHREVAGFVGGRSCVCPELRLAPFVRTLCFYTELDDGFPCRQSALAWTRCAAAELRLDFEDDDASTYTAAAAIIGRQEALGRLRSLTVHFQAEIAPLLLGTVATIPGLEKLEVRVWDLSFPATLTLPFDCTLPAPSLRQFTCYLCPEMEPFVNLILAGHAATLETVDLNSEESGIFCVATVPLLARLPKLTKLTCCNIPGVEAVAFRDSLRKLELTVRTENEHRGAVAGAAALLRRASQLREVKVSYCPGSPDGGVDVIWALASSGRSHLESLEIDNFLGSGQYFCHLQELITVMPSLPSMRHLRVVVGSVEKMDELALAITPATTPALSTVELGLGVGPCGHAWLHRDAFKTLMSKNPLLHWGLYAVHPYYCGEKSCEACGEGCHEVVKKLHGYDYHLFWHDLDEKCTQDHSVKSYQLQ